MRRGISYASFFTVLFLETAEWILDESSSEPESGVYKTGAFSSVSVPRQNTSVLGRGRSKGINRKGINLRFHEFCYGFCKEHPERIDNVKMMLYCFLCYHDNTIGQVGNTLFFLDKGKRKLRSM